MDFITSNAPMGLGFKPITIKHAEEIYKNVKKLYPTVEIVHTGHSMGGSIAQIMSAKTGDLAITYNAFGTGSILYNQGYVNQKELNIIFELNNLQSRYIRK